MYIPRLSSLASRTLLPAVLGLAVFATACTGGDSTDNVVAALEAASQAESQQISSTSDTEAAFAESNPRDSETDAARFASAMQSSTNFAEAPVGDGRVLVAVSCLEGFNKPTAQVTVLGSGLETGNHESVITPPVGIGLALVVRDEAVQDLPAGSAYRAFQTAGFDSAEYEFSWESLDVTLAVPGC